MCPNLAFFLCAVDYPHILEEQSRRDSKLDDRLKQVFVRSHDPIVSILVTFFFSIATFACCDFYGITNSSAGEIFG